MFKNNQIGLPLRIIDYGDGKYTAANVTINEDGKFSIFMEFKSPHHSLLGSILCESVDHILDIGDRVDTDKGSGKRERG